MNLDADNLLEPLLSVPELAEYLGVPVQTIYDWRLRGEGPRAYRFGNRIKFAVSDRRASLGEQPPRPQHARRAGHRAGAGVSGRG